ncbi:MAG: hypothetical protein IJQ25_09805, partial [Oscillibacter sp.]|nr:hypothetical protein [Oscillibacter sp.]
MNVVTVRAKRLCAMWMAVFMLLFSVPVPVAMATEPVGGGTSETTVTLAFKDDAQWNNNATLGDYYSVNIIASSDAGDSFPMCATQVYIRFDPNVLTFVSAQLRNKIAAFQVPDPEDLSGGTMSVDVSSNTLTEKLQEGYIGFTHFKPASLGQSYNTVVNNGQTIATLNFQPANDAARSQTAQLSFVSATGTTSQVGFFENLSSTSSTQYTLSLGAPHTVPALNAPVNTHTVTVTNGTGGGDYAENASVTITANDAPTGQRFKEWTGADTLTFTEGSKTTTPASFTRPAGAVSVTATYEDIPPVTFPVTVNNGTGGGDYAANATVTITANDPAPGQRFKEWTGTNSLSFDRTTTPATFTMPAGAVSVTATYEDIPPGTYP